MTTVLVAVDSVHASARVADYLQDRLGGGTVHVAVPRPPEGDGPSERERRRDLEDALNGVRSRLGVVASVSPHRVEAPFADGLLSLADEVGADELVVCRGAGSGWDEWAGTVVEESSRPTVVVP